MKKTIFTVSVLFSCLVLFSSSAMAQKSSVSSAMVEATPDPLQKVHSLNVSPLGLLSGAYGVNYEHLFGGYHGVLVEGNYSNASNSESSSSSFGGTLGYRFHWSGSQDSGFLGVNVGYHSGGGEGIISDGSTTKSFNVDTTLSSITANVGRRWAWENGFNITLRVGVGQGNYEVTTDSEDPDAQKAVKVVDELLTVFPVAFDGELSIGRIF